jgi:hypothetical protein
LFVEGAPEPTFDRYRVDIFTLDKIKVSEHFHLDKKGFGRFRTKMWPPLQRRMFVLAGEIALDMYRRGRMTAVPVGVKLCSASA